MAPDYWTGETRFAYYTNGRPNGVGYTTLNPEGPFRHTTEEPARMPTPESLPPLVDRTPSTSEHGTSSQSTTEPVDGPLTADQLALPWTPEEETNLDIQDYWSLRGTTWTRHHQLPRDTLFCPNPLDPDGPDTRNLLNTRTTTMNINYPEEEIMQFTMEDDWTTEGAKQTEARGWTGTSTFYKSVTTIDTRTPLPVPTDSATKAKPRSTPKDVSEEERLTHELTHLPMRNWCELCVEAKGRDTKHQQRKDDQPVIQVDYCFMRTTLDDAVITILVRLM